MYCQSATSRICCCRNVLFIKVSSNRNRPKELICFEGKKAPELAIGKSTHQLLWSVTERRWLLLLPDSKSLTAVPHTWNYIFWFPILDTTLTDFFFQNERYKQNIYDRRNLSHDRDRGRKKSRKCAVFFHQNRQKNWLVGTNMNEKINLLINIVRYYCSYKLWTYYNQPNRILFLKWTIT